MPFLIFQQLAAYVTVTLLMVAIESPSSFAESKTIVVQVQPGSDVVCVTARVAFGVSSLINPGDVVEITSARDDANSKTFRPLQVRDVECRREKI